MEVTLAAAMVCCAAILSVDLKRIARVLEKAEEELGNLGDCGRHNGADAEEDLNATV